jgi:plastocyanin
VFSRINPSTMNALVEVDAGADPSDIVRIQAYDELREGESRRFDPAELEVDLGTTLTVANVGGLEHSFVAGDGSLATGTIAPGADQGTFAGTSAEVVAGEAGTFEFFCELFPDEMRGVLRVVDPSPPTTVPATTVPADDDGGGEAAAAAPASAEEDRGVGGAVAGAVVVLVGVAAILLALVPRGRRRPTPPTAF